jgi:hypothetical protein
MFWKKLDKLLFGPQYLRKRNREEWLMGAGTVNGIKMMMFIDILVRLQVFDPCTKKHPWMVNYKFFFDRYKG